MKTVQTTSILIAVCVLLSACASVGVTSNSNSIKQVREITLADGTVTRVGFKPAESDWNCTELDKQTSNAGMNKLKGAISFSGPFKVMEEEAVNYANSKQLKPNYIYLYVPTEVAVGSLDTSVFSKSQSTYYQCDKVPDVKDNISSILE
jgi:hypothetical protein